MKIVAQLLYALHEAHVYKSLSLVHILPYLRKIRFNNILPPTPRPPKLFFQLRCMILGSDQC
jgi:hypothetical protein